MFAKRKEIMEELRSVVSGKTLDALLPPLVFVIVNELFGLYEAVFTALGLAFLLMLARLVRRHRWYYALGGLLGVGLAASIALITRSAAGYFLPALISSSLLLLLILVSLAAGKPAAAWASHLTRGWPLEWFWRKDIKPAYREVTMIWASLVLVRLFIQVILYRGGDLTRLAWANALLGWPVIVIVLVASYIYGIKRLKSLGGPGVEEFRDHKDPPWQGQTRGF